VSARPPLDSSIDADVVPLAPHLAAGRRRAMASAWDDGTVHARSRRIAEVAHAHAASRRRGTDEPATGGAPDGARGELLADDELATIEETYKDGLTAVQIVEVFTRRGVKFSEASFRKYVQQGLLPRSRRVGRKGKHRGSLGLYPAKTVRRINAVKRLMIEGHTIEEIQGQHLLYTDLVENIGEGLIELLDRLDADAAGPSSSPERRKALHKDLVETRRMSDELTRRLTDLARRAAAPRNDRMRRTGAAGSAEDLL
jgi:DNA-binding transcriptional MerR regulator